MKRITFFKWMLLVAVVFLGIGSASAQVSIVPGGTVTQDFSIGTTATAAMPSGWKVDKNTTVRLVGSYSAAVSATEKTDGNSMSATAGNGIYNFGAGVAATATDRAVGGLSSGSASKSVNVYVQLSNSGASGITSFTISYNVEKYRMGSNAAGFSIQMYYSTDGTTWTSAGSDFLTTIAADASNNGYTSAPGATVNVATKTLSQTLAAGASIYLAWNYSVASGTTTSNAQALGIDDVTIVANGGVAPVATPTISPATGTYYSAQSVSLACATSGASIYYTTDGTDPDNTKTLYSTPFSVSTTTTVKAIAYKDGTPTSSIASAVYTFPIVNNVADIAALRAGTADNATVYRLTGEAVLTLKSANNNVKYIQDATGAIQIYDAGGIITTAFNAGDGITNLMGKLTSFNGMLELIPVSNPGAATSTGNTVTPLSIDLANLANYPGQLVKVSGATITGTGNFAASTSYNLNSSTTTVLRSAYTDLPWIGQAIPSAAQDITGVVLISSTVAQLVPRTIADFTNTVYSTPTIIVTEATVPAMTAQVGLTDTETITVSGSNLTGNITLALSGTDASLFSLSTSSIVPASGTVTDYAVTVTYTPVASGSHTATLTLSSTGATDVTRSLSATATWAPVAAPVATDATGVNSNGFTANWNAVAGATGYKVDVYTKTGGGEVSVLSENFNGFTAGATGSGASGTDVSASLDTYTQTTGWTGSKVYAAAGTIKVGTSGTLGYIVTPDINLSANSGNFTVAFESMAWSGDSTGVKVYVNDVLAATVQGLKNGADYVLTPLSVSLTGGTAATKLKFEGKQAVKGRFFLENLVVKQGGLSSTPIAGSPFTVTGETTKSLTGLTPSTTYYYTVKAYNEHVESTSSNEISAITSFNTGIDNTILKGIRVSNGKIMFDAAAGETVELYNAVGQKLMHHTTVDGLNILQPESKGIMLVKSGNQITKVIL